MFVLCRVGETSVKLQKTVAKAEVRFCQTKADIEKRKTQLEKTNCVLCVRGGVYPLFFHFLAFFDQDALGVFCGAASL